MKSEQIVSDLEKEIESYFEKGYRLDMIMPADSPTSARVSRNGDVVCLQTSQPNSHDESLNENEIIVTRFDDNIWVEGRAGMQYRDLIPGRLGGHVIASHIRLANGGEVPDYVHYHKVRFQIIYCKSGWIRVVYEDQGPPFVLNAGDCVLQPPEIRHRVLESSTGAEVIEISCPAVHETWIDHGMQLPTPNFQPERIFNGHRFVRYVASEAKWIESPVDGFEMNDIGVTSATNGLVQVWISRSISPSVEKFSASQVHWSRSWFIFVLSGNLRLRTREQNTSKLNTGDNLVVPAGIEFTLQSDNNLEMLEILF